MTNPCKGVSHNPENERERLISQDEYSALLDVTNGTPW
jgi:hypothetical protein